MDALDAVYGGEVFFAGHLVTSSCRVDACAIHVGKKQLEPYLYIKHLQNFNTEPTYCLTIVYAGIVYTI
jgi:hypothetical protein